MEEKGDEFLKMIGSTGTKKILELIYEHGTAQYKDFQPFMNAHTLNRRLRELLICGLLEHHIKKEEKRMEWYTITERGKKVAKLLGEIVALKNDHIQKSKSKDGRTPEKYQEILEDL